MKIIPFFMLLLQASTALAYQEPDPVLWYEKAAATWTEALPVGNGRLGAMVHGKTAREEINLNEESLWAGQPGHNNNPGAKANLASIQSALLAGNPAKAMELSKEHLLGVPFSMRSYQPLATLFFEPGNKGSINSYKRSLNLFSGIATTQYQSGGVTWSREVFASAPDNMIVVRIRVDKPGALNGKVSLFREMDATVAPAGNALLLTGQLMDVTTPAKGKGGAGMRYAAMLQPRLKGGKMLVRNNSILIEDADELTLLITAATDYNFATLGFNRSKNPELACRTILEKAAAFSAPQLADRHLAEFRLLMERVRLQLSAKAFADIPTSKRLENVQQGATDPVLEALYFQYGRYLLASSSRSPGILPANLQGKWNPYYEAPWNSDYHTNINLQMNYWHAEVTNLSEAVDPLIRFIDHYRVPGRVTAKDMYGAKGWTIHHSTDILGKAGVMDGIQWGTSPLAAAWLCTHLWEHFLFTGDTAYLRQKGYPIMREAAVFVQDFLIQDSKGRLVIAPSMSPENSYKLPDGSVHQISYAPSIDVQTVHALFDACRSATAVLDTDKDFAQLTLAFGVNDIDGTIDDTTKIYSMAGAEEQTPSMTTEEIVTLIKQVARIPVERDTLYNVIQTFE